MAKKTENSPVESVPEQNPERMHGKATILSSSRWKASDRLLLGIALADGGRYTMSEAQAALDALKRKKVQ